MSWLLILAAAWTLLSVPLALLVGRMIRIGDLRRAAEARQAVPDHVPAGWTTTRAASR